MSAQNDTPQGAIAVYDEKQAGILRGEAFGIVAVGIIVLGLVVLAFLLTKGLAAGGFTYRAENNYNYAGVQTTDINAYMQANKIAVTPISATAITAYNTWAQKNPKAVNVKVLSQYLGDDYNNTSSIYNYMTLYVAAGMGVSCEYCHNLTDFSLDDMPQKVAARNMFIMQFEVNNKWINSIPKPADQPVYQIQCATCHVGAAKSWNKELKAKDPAAFGVEGGGLPKNFEVVDDTLLKVRPDATTFDVNYFKVTAAKDSAAGLNDTYRNQNQMYHQTVALGVGCDFCHYAGYFASYVTENGSYKWPKAQARHMIGIVQDLAVNWWPQLQFPDPATPAQPNCYMCHRGISIPPGASNTAPQPAKVAAPLIKPLEELPIPKSVTQ
jgi:photosynthetic reaction center cytochrome c subunit